MINGNLKASYAADEAILNTGWMKLFVYGTMALLALYAVTANDYWILIGCKIGILLIAGVGVNILTGYTGLVSLGHAAFVAIGAYGTVILHNALDGIIPAPLLVFIAVPAAIAISAFVGIIVGLPSLRVKGLYLAVATLAANFIVIFLVEQDVFAPWTGGIVGVDTPVPNILGWQLDTEREMFVLIAALAFSAILLGQNLFRTRIGRAFIAIRDRDYSAEILGISLLRYKLLSFALSAGFCGLSGALFAYFYASILPEQFQLDLSLELVAIVIIGGLGRTMGPVYGALIIVLMPELLKIAFGMITGDDAGLAQLRAPLQEIAFGALLIFFLLKEPLGISHIIDRLLRATNRWPFARG